jgi:NAD+ kinase
MVKPRIIILADTDRPEVTEPLQKLRRGIAEHVNITAVLEADGEPLDDAIDADMAVAIGGDGTIMSQARRLVDHGIPLIGVNFGRFGFLAEFDVRSLTQQAPTLFTSPPPVREYMLLSVRVRDAHGSDVHRALAMNDAVITAGPPFRMIELHQFINGNDGPVLNGDGVIVSTPGGTTAYNVSAGGPIVHPDIEAMIITPLAVHSLAFRPIVAPADEQLMFTVTRANAGTTLVLDGQDTLPLSKDMSVTITRHHKRVRLVTNPLTSYWTVLLEKMRWAAPPTYRDRGP